MLLGCVLGSVTTAALFAVARLLSIAQRVISPESEAMGVAVDSATGILPYLRTGLTGDSARQSIVRGSDDGAKVSRRRESIVSARLGVLVVDVECLALDDITQLHGEHRDLSTVSTADFAAAALRARPGVMLTLYSLMCSAPKWIVSRAAVSSSGLTLPRRLCSSAPTRAPQLLPARSEQPTT